MAKRDAGTIHKVTTLIMILWMVVCFGVFMEISRACFLNQYLEDCLTQSNLAAILVDPYHYGSAGELIFEDIYQTKKSFLKFLDESLGDEKVREKLGISSISIKDFRIYEVTKDCITEFKFIENENSAEKTCYIGEEVNAPDGTLIQSSAVYVKAEVEMNFAGGIRVVSVKEHCVDIVREETDYE